MIENRLLKRMKTGNLRELKQCSTRIDFSSNDYLGLARSSRLAKAVREKWAEQESLLKGFGSTGSRLLTGNSPFAENLEYKIAKFHGYESCLLFNCGYMANLGLLTAIATAEWTILYDSAVHASTLDGIRLSRAKAFPFKHNDLSHLESRLQKRERCLVCIESIYSTDGSMAPLQEISQLVKKYNALLIVDEAHATGIFGPQGKGLVAQHHLMDSIFAHVVTFGKALGTFGAAVLGCSSLKKLLLNFSRSCIYSTSLPLVNLLAIHCSYELFPRLEKERKHLGFLIETFPTTSTTAIQPLVIPGNSVVKRLSETLLSRGYDVRALLSPTVQKGKEILRICLHAFNTEEEVRSLSHLLKAL